MRYGELAVFDSAVKLAAAFRADERPDPDQATPDNVVRYVNRVLDLVLGSMGIDFNVRPMAYPKASKVPVIIELPTAGECLFWYYPFDNDAEVARELAGAMENVMCGVMGRPAEGGVA